MDIHICGTCRMQYSSIEDFVQHKKSGCLLATNGPVSANAGLCDKNVPVYGLPQAQTNITQIQIADTYGPQITQTAPLNQTPDISKDVQPAYRAQQELSDKDKKKQTGANSKSSQRKTPGERNERGPPQKRFKCNVPSCKFVTAHHKDLQRHKRTHTGEKPFVCQFCQKRFSRNDKRKIHERNHTGEKPYKCLTCNYACADGGSLKKHLRIHTDERPYQCQLCPYASRNSSQLVVHLRAHTGDAPFHCQRCDAKFKTNSDLKRHLRIHTGEKPFSCEQCDYSSRLKCNLKSHINSNHMGKKKYQCEECEYTCRTHKQLNAHTNTHHVPPKPTSYKCMECPFTTASKLAFHRHERKHSDERPYKCKFCQYTSKYPGHVPIHMKKKHPEKGKVKGPVKRSVKPKIKFGIKNSAASKADRPGKSAVKIPLPVIDGKKPYQCADCEASFVREDSLRSHHRQHERLTEALESTAYAVLQLQNVPPTTTGQEQTRVSNMNTVDTLVTSSGAVMAQSTANAISSEMIVVNVQNLDEITSINAPAALPSNIYSSSQTTPISNTPTELLNLNLSGNMVAQSQVHSVAQAVQLQSGLSTISSVIPAKASVIMPQHQSGQPTTVRIVSSNPTSRSVNQPQTPAEQSVTSCNVSSFPSSRINFMQSETVSSAIESPNISRVSLQMGNSSAGTLQVDSSGRQMDHHSVSLPTPNPEHTSLLGTVGPEQSHTPSTLQEQSSVVQTQTLGYGTSNIPVLYTTLTPTPNAAIVSEKSQSPASFNQINSQSETIQPDSVQVAVSKVPVNINILSATNVKSSGQGTVKVLYTDPSRGVGALLGGHSLQHAVISQTQQQQSIQIQPAMNAPRIHIPAILPRPSDGRESKTNKLHPVATPVAQTQQQLRHLIPIHNRPLQTASIVAATNSTTLVMPSPAVNVLQCGPITDSNSNLQLTVQGVRPFSSCQ